MQQHLVNLYEEIQNDVSKHVEHYISQEAKGCWRVCKELESKNEILTRFVETLTEFWNHEHSAYYFEFQYDAAWHYQIKLKVKCYIEYPAFHKKASEFMHELGGDLEEEYKGQLAEDEEPSLDKEQMVADVKSLFKFDCLMPWCEKAMVVHYDEELSKKYNRPVVGVSAEDFKYKPEHDKGEYEPFDCWLHSNVLDNIKMKELGYTYEADRSHYFAFFKNK